ncbi:Leukotriene A-4 hydrolase [Trichoplax sp. H2]|nr:Leukotriene A-4 hydrolase [Trichoplax sp. H2]|eukprot:RDD36645.1 Leukotriene A-4 hydrolase [Trichoplax sp. H2]
MADPTSFSNFDQCLVSHMSLDWSINFDTKRIEGNVTLATQVVADDVSKLILDTRDIAVTRIFDNDTGKDFNYSFTENIPALGTALEIQLSETIRGAKANICIEYKTDPNASAIQWLDPLQTSGKKQPYMFTQCQAIHARSLVPCQDIPGVKITYKAKLNVPSGLVAVTSAIRRGDEIDTKDPTRKIFFSEQSVPIPSYLIALAVGALESRRIGPRSHVWSEKETVDAGAFEFSETETMLKIAEDLLGPYLWDQYDLLLLPPSFPYGGMENPCLTFVTPTLLAGDKSLANVIAHEIAHSWTGNLVTNASWEDFWLNEGHTVFVERKIAGRMFGEKMRQFAAIGGWKDLMYSVKRYGDNHPFTALVPKLDRIDPDDAFSSVPYEKGFALLYHLEQVVGGPEVFEPFLKSYIQHFKYKSLKTSEWKDYLFSYFIDKDTQDALAKVDWDGWINKPGMPPTTLEYDTSLADACTELCNRWLKASEEELESFSSDDIKDFSSPQVIEFLSKLLVEAPITVKKVKAMDKAYSMGTRINSEIRFRWLRICVRGGWENSYSVACSFITEQGRMKFVRPLYRDLYNNAASRDLAKSTFGQNCNFYHNIASKMIASDLQM